jgi:O-antigen/teichoic acid export membrane protein
MAVLTAQAVRERGRPEVYAAAKAAGILTVAGLATGLSNLIFNVIAARASGAERYGGIGTLLALVTVASYLAIATAYAVARRTALTDLSARLVLARAAKSLVPWIACLLPVLIAVGPLTDFLHISSELPGVLALGTVLVMLVGSLATGVLIGRMRFKVVAAISIGSALVRVLLGIALPKLFDVTIAALLATLLPVVVVCVTSILVVVRIGASEGSAAAVSETLTTRDLGKGLARDSIAGAAGAMALWAVWAAPLLAARHGLSSGESGRFTAAQVLAGAVLYIVAPVTMAFFPTISRHRTTDTVTGGALMSGALALVGACMLVVFGPVFVTTVYGPQFSTSRGLFLELGLSATCVAIGTFALWASRARYGRTSRVTIVAATALALEGAAEVLLHPSAGMLALTPLAAMTIASMLGLLLFVAQGGSIAPTLRRLAAPMSPRPEDG